MDGWVVVGTKLDTKQLEKDLKSSERKLQQYEKEAEKLTKAKAKIEIDLADYENAKKNIREMTNEALRLAQTEGEVSTQLKLEKVQLEELNQKYSKQLSSLDEVNKKIKQNAKNQSLVTSEIEKTNQKLNQSKGISNINDIMTNINKSTTSAIRQVSKWALAIFGVRSAYMFVRQSASTLAQYNDQIATDLEYISFAMASMLQPVIEALIRLAYKLLTYVNFIAKAWFGVDLFANSSAKAMDRGAKSAEKMKKSLAGFDEMNVLNDNGTTGAMGSALPSFDLSAPEDIPIPKWLQWIADNKDLVISGLMGIAGGLIAVKNGLNLIQGFGIVVAIMGIIQAMEGLKKFLEDPSFPNFIEIMEGTSKAVLGVGIALMSLPTIIAGIALSIATFFTENYYTVLGLFDKVIAYVGGPFKQKMTQNFGLIGKMISTTIQGIVIIFKGFFESFYGGFRSVIDGVIKLFKGDLKGGIRDVMNGIVLIVFSPLNAIISGVNALIKGLNKIKISIPDWVPKFGGEEFKINIPQIPKIQLPKLAKGTILNYPGNGVPVAGGSAIAGEAGREAYLPLSNTQLLEELGSTIGKYITINANITNTMNGRVISRELQKINANSDFAKNS